MEAVDICTLRTDLASLEAEAELSEGEMTDLQNRISNIEQKLDSLIQSREKKWYEPFAQVGTLIVLLTFVFWMGIYKNSVDNLNDAIVKTAKADDVNYKFEKVDQRFDKVEQRLDKVEQRLEKVELTVNYLKENMVTKADLANYTREITGAAKK